MFRLKKQRENRPAKKKLGGGVCGPNVVHKQANEPF